MRLVDEAFRATNFLPQAGRSNTAAAMVCALLFFTSVSGTAAELKQNETLLKLKPNTWIKLHEQKKGEGVTFKRQAHGGSCFDSKRGQLILFGSNTHSRDWKNSPFMYDSFKNEWSQVYPDDKPSTYKVNEQGLPVAGEKGDHPWATHTFGAVVYDAKRDEMVVACYPGHMRPDKWGKAVKHLWPNVKQHPTWVFKLETRTWEALPCKAVHFFPNSAGYDSDRGVVIGHQPAGIWELSGEPRAWTSTVKKRLLNGWGHDNCSFDAKHKKLIIFGINTNANDIVVYDPASKDLKKMPTTGPRPPADQHNPMAFDPEAGQTVILVDRTIKKDKADKDTTETWCYDLGKDAWTQIKTATLPFPCAMNFNMEYDTNHKVLLLVAGYKGSTTVWGLKINLAGE